MRRVAVIALAALLAAPVISVPRPALAAPAAVKVPSSAVQGVAVVNVAYVIDESAPGKEGRQYLGALRKKLAAELEDYKKSIAKDKNAKTKTAEKEKELNEYFRAEYARVSNLVSAELNRLSSEWLAKNGSHVTAVLPASAVIAIKPENDISREILSRLNGVKINFAEGAPARKAQK